MSVSTAGEVTAVVHEYAELNLADPVVLEGFLKRRFPGRRSSDTCLLPLRAGLLQRLGHGPWEHTVSELERIGATLDLVAAGPLLDHHVEVTRLLKAGSARGKMDTAQLLTDAGVAYHVAILAQGTR